MRPCTFCLQRTLLCRQKVQGIAVCTRVRKLRCARKSLDLHASHSSPEVELLEFLKNQETMAMSTQKSFARKSYWLQALIVFLLLPAIGKAVAPNPPANVDVVATNALLCKVKCT